MNDALLTAFETLDGAASLRILSPDGSRAVTDQVLAWNRWQDWARLSVPRTKGLFLKRATNYVNVGDHCVFLEIGASGSRLTDGTITGKEHLPTRRRYENGAMAVPISQVPDIVSRSAKTSLAELDRRGEFLAPVAKSGLIGFAQLAVASGKGTNRLNAPHEYRWIFSRREGHATLFVNWQPTSKAKGRLCCECSTRTIERLQSQDQTTSICHPKTSSHLLGMFLWKNSCPPSIARTFPLANKRSGATAPASRIESAFPTGVQRGLSRSLCLQVSRCWSQTY